jgi:diguanylate cyclase (GGDEF)-like protein
VDFTLSEAPRQGPGPLPQLDPVRLADAFRAAEEALASGDRPAVALDCALGELHERLGGFVAALVREHDRVWLVGSRGYAMIPDGLPISAGVVGRAVRTGRMQYIPDLAADPDYVEAAKGVVAELAIPVRVNDEIVGVVNIETVAALPRQAPKLAQSFAQALAPVLQAVRGTRVLDLPALARLFVYLSSLRDPREIAEIAAASFARVLGVQTSQLAVMREDASLELVAERRIDESQAPPDLEALEWLRQRVEHSAVIAQVELPAAHRPQHDSPSCYAIVLPLRVGGLELGILVGSAQEEQTLEREQAEAAAVLAAHVAAALDAALSLGRERRSALTDPLTGVLNRRGFEVELDRALTVARDARTPLSVCVLDCDDFKEVNDRAGHEFGDGLLRELSHVLLSILPESACAGRIGGDEFVVLLPDTDADAAEEASQELLKRLEDGLEDSGYPIRLSIGVAVFPFDGGAGSQLVRAADQALYGAKAAGKDRVVGFRSLVQAGTRVAAPLALERRAAFDPAMLVEATEAAAAIWREGEAPAILRRLCKTLTFVAGATGCVVSRVVGDHLYDEVAHALRQAEISADTAYLIDDFPVTKAVLESFESRAISFLDTDLDRAEAFVLRDMKMNCALLVPIVLRGRAWGLVELYDMRLRRYTREEEALTEFLVSVAARKLETLDDEGEGNAALPLYRVPG